MLSLVCIQRLEKGRWPSVKTIHPPALCRKFFQHDGPWILCHNCWWWIGGLSAGMLRWCSMGPSEDLTLQANDCQLQEWQWDPWSKVAGDCRMNGWGHGSLTLGDSGLKWLKIPCSCSLHSKRSMMSCRYFPWDSFQAARPWPNKEWAKRQIPHHVQVRASTHCEVHHQPLHVTIGLHSHTQIHRTASFTFFFLTSVHRSPCTIRSCWRSMYDTILLAFPVRYDLESLSCTISISEPPLLRYAVLGEYRSLSA